MKHATRNSGLRFAAVWLLLALPALASTPFVESGFTLTALPALGTNNGAVAYAPDGTLYVVHGGFDVSLHSSTIDVVNSNGTLGTPLVVQNASFGGIGGATWDPATGQLLITDNTAGSVLYSVPVTGVLSGGHVNVTASTILSDPSNTIVPFIAHVVVRPSTNDIFVSDSPFGAAGIVQINRATGAPHTVLQTTFDFTGGIGFDTLGNVIYQAGAFNLSGGAQTANVFKAALASTGATTTAASPQLLDSNVGSFDLSVTSGNHVLVTGIVPQSTVGGQPDTFGLFQPGSGTNAADSVATFPTANTGDFGANMAYLPGTSDFTPFSGHAGGRMAFVLSDFSGGATGTSLSNNVFLVTPVPEPGTFVLALMAGLLFIPLLGAGGVAAALPRFDSLIRFG